MSDSNDDIGVGGGLAIGFGVSFFIAVLLLGPCSDDARTQRERDAEQRVRDEAIRYDAAHLRRRDDKLEFVWGPPPGQEHKQEVPREGR